MNPMTAALLRVLSEFQQPKKEPKKKYNIVDAGIALHLAESRTTLTTTERALDDANQRHLLPGGKLKQVPIFYAERIDYSRYRGDDLRAIRSRSNTQEAERRRKRMSPSAAA